jgi:diaminopimelate decarboxylase
MHIGSQITDLDPFGNAFALLADFVRQLRSDGHTISHVDLGGGWGFPIATTTSRRRARKPMPKLSSARRAASAAN